jgi:hypothetical protein
MALALPLNLSDNDLKQAHFNTVLVQQEKVDRVGFELTTSAAHQLSMLLLSTTSYLRGSSYGKRRTSQIIPRGPPFFFDACSVALYRQSEVLTKPAKMVEQVRYC